MPIEGSLSTAEFSSWILIDYFIKHSYLLVG